jgi:hypothetical protein
MPLGFHVEETLRIFKNVVLRKIYGPQKEEDRRGWSTS